MSIDGYDIALWEKCLKLSEKKGYTIVISDEYFEVFNLKNKTIVIFNSAKQVLLFLEGDNFEFKSKKTNILFKHKNWIKKLWNSRIS